jgi:hypothetical protein
LEKWLVRQNNAGRSVVTPELVVLW